MLPLGAALPAAAQYPGHTQSDQKVKVVPPRAVGVLEWTGEAGKPKASRIVPVTVFIDGEYQDGGLYLAQPAPLAVETDTVYELERAGVPTGDYDISGGEKVGDAWYGFGDWKPLPAPKPVKKLPASKNPAPITQDHDPDRPHFKGSGDATGSGDAQRSPAPVDDPDKPTLHRRADSGDASSGGNAPAAGTGTTGSNAPAQQDDPDKPTLHRRADSDSSQASGAGTAPDDPDRPHLKKRSDASADSAKAGGEDQAAITTATQIDPDRPRLERGKPKLSLKELEATKLRDMPPDLQQMAAVSDPTFREEHPFTYQWANPDDAVKMQAAVETIATRAVLASLAPPAATIPQAGAKAGMKTSVKPAARAKSGSAHSAAPKAPPVMFADKDFHAYELSYSGGATLVFSAKATVTPAAASKGTGAALEKYVTIIAQPDFDGVPQVRLQSVTDAAHFDITPRMRLVDAVDTDGDNRAELVFELRRATDRQFAIYKVRGAHAEQAFATEPQPYSSPIHIGMKTN